MFSTDMKVIFTMPTEQILILRQLILKHKLFTNSV